MAPDESRELKEPLMQPDDAEWIPSTKLPRLTSPQTKASRQNALRWLAVVVPWCLLALLGSWNWIRYLKSEQNKCNSSQLVYTPVNHLLEYELRYFGTAEPGDPSPYFGEPSPELDDAWKDLYPSLYQLIPQDQAAQLANPAVVSSHDPGRPYIVKLDVFHQLHCLNIIRKSARPDYYPGFAPGMVDGHEEDLLFGPKHINHCIEVIRQALTCNVDVTPYTWIWNATAKEMQTEFAAPHTCRNFDKIREWSIQNAMVDTVRQTFTPSPGR